VNDPVLTIEPKSEKREELTGEKRNTSEKEREKGSKKK
jgi:hypothetical protein